MITNDGRAECSDDERENRNISLPYNLVEPWYCPNIWQPCIQFGGVIPEPIVLRSVINILSALQKKLPRAHRAPLVIEQITCVEYIFFYATVRILQTEVMLTRELQSVRIGATLHQNMMCQIRQISLNGTKIKIKIRRLAKESKPCDLPNWHFTTNVETTIILLKR